MDWDSTTTVLSFRMGTSEARKEGAPSHDASPHGSPPSATQ
jgi:hypothetical protein